MTGTTEDDRLAFITLGGDLTGAELLDQVHSFLGAYVAFPSSAAGVAVTLWAVHTHMADAFESTPRLALVSPEPGCGKSRVLELLELLCASAETLSDASPAYLYRRIGAGEVTVLLDEADTVFRKSKAADESSAALRRIVNAGHRRGATVGRTEMIGNVARLVNFPVYAPVALAAIGTLPGPIISRSVVIRMRRRAPDEEVRDYRERITRPEGHQLREQVAKWALTVAGQVGDPWPVMPPGVSDRPADVWEPLLALADLAGGTWPDRARSACVALVTGAQDDSASIGTQLLRDIRDVWPRASVTSATSVTPLISPVTDVALVTHMGTEDLLHRLASLDESPWGDWHGHALTNRDLARLLKPYGIRPALVRLGGQVVRGYRAADMHDAWQRYLPDEADG